MLGRMVAYRSVLVWASCAGLWLLQGPLYSQQRFVRGDADGNGFIELTDAVFVLNFLFTGGRTPTCFDAADSDDKGTAADNAALNLTDAVYLLQYLFLGGPAPPAPSPSGSGVVKGSDCGLDPTDDALDCASYSHCPPPATVVRTSPADGEGTVTITRHLEFEFSKPINPETVDEGSIRVQFGSASSVLRGRFLPSKNHTIYRCFLNDFLPASARVRVSIVGDLLEAEEGAVPVDADGDGQYGGTKVLEFETASMTRIDGADVFGYVLTSEGALPIAGVRISVDGFDDELATVTDAAGRFELMGVPSPEFFFSIDGNHITSKIGGTAQDPKGRYPRLGKRSKSVPGHNIEIETDGEKFKVYLPFLPDDTFTDVRQGQPTDVKLNASGMQRCMELLHDAEACEKLGMTVPADTLMEPDGSLGSKVGIFPVDPTRLPAPLPNGLQHTFDITVQADATVFDQPVPMTVPNVPDKNGKVLAPGEKMLLMSFDHPSGKWVVAGTMQVSADGTVVETIEGGVRAPGWHGFTLLTPFRWLKKKWEGVSGGSLECTCNLCALNIISCAIGIGLKKWTALISCTSMLRNCGKCYGALFDIFALGAGGGLGFPDDVSDLFFRIGPIMSRIEQSLLDLMASDSTVTPEQLFELVGSDLQKLNEILNDEAMGVLRRYIAEFPETNIVPASHDTLRYRVLSETGQVIRGLLPTGDTSTLVLSPEFTDSGSTVWFFDGLSLQFASAEVPEKTTNAARTAVDTVMFSPDITDSSNDRDADGLADVVEMVLGSDPADVDTDKDGLPDGAELLQGLDPLDGLPVRTGILSSVDTPGNAVDVCASNDIALVADFGRGLTVVNVANAFRPVAISQVDTPGDAQRVACWSSFAVVADGPGGIAMIDFTDPPAARIAYTLTTKDLGGQPTCVTVGGGLAFVGTSESKVLLLDVETGFLLEVLQVASPPTDLALSEDSLCVLQSSRMEMATFEESPPRIVGSVPFSGGQGSGRRVAAGDGVAYVVFDRGFSTFNVANPSAPAYLGLGTSNQVNWRHLAVNGSGTAVAAVGVNLFGEPRDVYLYDVKDPSRADRFVTAIPTPGLAEGVSIYNGLAFVADAESGLHVLNYLKYDDSGIPPTASIETNLPPGINTIEEGKLLRITAAVTDNVQVRNVEFYVDGERAFTDGSFPFEHRLRAPRLGGGGQFIVQAKAIDTGGNEGLSQVLTVGLTRDATMPQLRRTLPAAGAATLPISAVGVTFNEPMDVTSLTTTRFSVLGPGPDRVLDTADDAVLAGGSVSYREESNTAFLAFGSPLAIGPYRATLEGAVSDSAGNPLGAGAIWEFRLYRALPPAMGPTAMAITKESVSRSQPMGRLGLVIRHPDPLDAFSLVVEHGALILTGHELGDELAAKSAEFVQVDSIAGGRARIAVLIERDAPRDFRTLDAHDPMEALRFVFSTTGASAVNAVLIVREPVGPGGLLPELTVQGRAVLPAELIDGELVITE